MRTVIITLALLFFVGFGGVGIMAWSASTREVTGVAAQEYEFPSYADLEKYAGVLSEGKASLRKLQYRVNTEVATPSDPEIVEYLQNIFHMAGYHIEAGYTALEILDLKLYEAHLKGFAMQFQKLNALVNKLVKDEADSELKKQSF